MNTLQLAEQFRRALQMFAQSLGNEDAMEVATVFPAWTVGKEYKINEYLIYGENSVGDPQLYQVLMGHTSQADWTPDITPSLYKPVGVHGEYPVWSQPVGAEDAYHKGDIVWYEDALYISDIDNNVWAPTVYGWSPYEE